ncbi:MAG: inorganic phosphate transporter [Nanoarchaeota archaeon]
MIELPLLVLIGVILALLFDFGNGLNDAANAVSTVVATRVLSLRQAVILSALGNFAGIFLFGVAVATTIGKGLILPDAVTPLVVVAGLVGSILWVYLATYLGLPISASHSLIGGFVGSAVSAAGFASIIYSGLLKIIAFIFVAPILGGIIAYMFQLFVFFLFRNASRSQVNPWFKGLQILSATAYSVSHGANDAQKTIGIITILLFSGGVLGATFHVPFWVVVASYTTIALGTLLGGVRVIRTMGLNLTKLQPVNGFCAETAGSLVVIGSTIAGIPVSTTHVITGAICGTGAVRRKSAVRWQLAKKIVYAWIVTIPISGLVGAGTYLIARLF